MSERWVLVSQAIAKLENKIAITREQAIASLQELVMQGRVAARVGTVVDWRGDHSNSNMPLNRSSLEEIFNLRSASWYKDNEAHFEKDFSYLGIEVRAKDLSAYFGSLPKSALRDEKASNEGQKMPGRPVHAVWEQAIPEVVEAMKQEGMTRPLEYGQKQKIIEALVEYTFKDESVRPGEGSGFSHAAARKHVDRVIEKLPLKEDGEQ